MALLPSLIRIEIYTGTRRNPTRTVVQAGKVSISRVPSVRAPKTLPVSVLEELLA